MIWPRIMYEFGRGLEELCKEENVTDISKLRREWVHKLVRDILDASTYWIQNCETLLNVDNWVDRSKKPTIRLTMEITSKDNFKLEWFPLKDEQEPWKLQKDFKYFSDHSYPWDANPENRILFIHEVRTMSSTMYERKSMVHFAQQIKELVEFITEILKNYVNVIELYAIEINETNKYNGFKIVSVEEKQRLANQRWLDLEFLRLNKSPEEFLNDYKMCEKSLEKFKRVGKFKGVRIRELKEIIDKVQTTNPELYMKIFPNEASGNIIPI